MQYSAICYREMRGEFEGSKRRELTALQVAGLLLDKVGHYALVFAEQLLPERGRDSRVRRFIGRGSALLDGLFQTRQKGLARVAAFHVLLELFA